MDEDITTPEESTSEKGGSSFLWVAGSLIVAVVLIIGALYMSGFITSPSSPSTDTDSVVAAVNGEDITRAELDEQIAQSQPLIEQQSGGSVGEEQITQAVLQGMINQVLLLQAADNADIAISDEDVDGRFSELIEQFGGDEAFQNELAKQETTQEEVREALRKQLISTAYMQQAVPTTGIEVSDEEVQNRYDLLVEQSENPEEIPSLEEVRESLRGQIQSEKALQLQEEAIQTLRDNADIEIYLEE